MRFTGNHSIASTLHSFIRSNERRFSGKRVLDIPAGRGETVALLQQIGASVHAMDLFPNRFDCADAHCEYADLNESIPAESEAYDFVFCQEGIEHISDQPAALRELARVLRPGGSLILTTPNPSNLRSRLSHLLNEAEHYRLMPPNEVDTIWLSEENNDQDKIYYGHNFLITLTKLRFLARLAGLSVSLIHHDRANNFSALLLPFFYPFILLTSISSYRRALRKRLDVSPHIKKNIYKDVLKTAIDPRNLIVSHIFVEFKKTSSTDGVIAELRALNKLSQKEAS